MRTCLKRNDCGDELPFSRKLDAANMSVLGVAMRDSDSTEFVNSDSRNLVTKGEEEGVEAQPPCCEFKGAHLGRKRPYKERKY